MTRRAKPEECDIQLDLDSPNPRAGMCWLGMPVGHLDVAIDGRAAELIEIYIQERLPHWHPLLRRLGLWAGYRGRGLGTILLEHVLAKLADRGVVAVWGKMGGDETLLVPWYRSIGFDVNQETGLVHKALP